MTKLRYALTASIFLAACEGEVPMSPGAPEFRAEPTHSTTLQDIEFVSAVLCLDTVKCPGGIRVTLGLTRNFAAGFTNLTYNVIEFVPDVGLVFHERGRGHISDADVVGDYRTGIRVTTNTDAASNPDYTRIGGDGGPIDVEIVPIGKFAGQRMGGGIRHGCTAGEVRHEFAAALVRSAPAQVTGSVFGAIGMHEKARIMVTRGNIVSHRIAVPANCP